jgi:hypothetical protein
MRGNLHNYCDWPGFNQTVLYDVDERTGPAADPEHNSVPSKNDAVDSDAELRKQYRYLLASTALHAKRAEFLEALAANERAKAAVDEEMARELGRFLCESEIIVSEERLRGSKLVAVALEILSAYGEEPIHYRTWYQLVINAGYTVGGKDPLATFLANVNRSDAVVSVGDRSGLYKLKQNSTT